MASLKLALLFSLSLIVLNFSVISIHALNVGVQADTALSLSKECSRKCESQFCNVPTPLLRYGKYCGLLYGGCPGEKPCDGLDACCMKHDDCIGAKNNDYLSQECNQNLLNCIDKFKESGSRTFKGNTCSVDEVTGVITVVIDAALLAGRYLHRP
uniref:phospholipase A2 n=1 Tax=Davidia involucrata TaxID=16924 RepID=A0A5B7CCT5_DAVIN